MGQVWSKANFDGNNPVDNPDGGRGSVLAVTSQNPGMDGEYGTGDDVPAPLNANPLWVANDDLSNTGCDDLADRVRNFASLHPDGAHFLFGGGSVRFINERIDQGLYRDLSTIAGGERLGEF